MIRVVCVGRLKSEFALLQEEYLKRIRGLGKIEVIEVKQDKDILNHIKRGSTYVCDERGKELTSQEFSNLLKEDVNFVIGGPEGFSMDIPGERISFSKMTFSHQLFRIMLLEQIYRGLCILHNHPYPK
ncbi:MAG: 23S rRNA (pseudouridine(1915)-N(3))-methyltransferase RlmH [Thermoplasmata archaeon]|nr:MAG: 23S rRNA (pseudouridine(1915)-N(3))-methyltransferase RlmH [Thermoplasmata archaeon]